MLIFCSAFTIPSLISSRRRKKQIKKIECLSQILGISINEIISIAGVGRYDLVDWKWDKWYVSQTKMYLLEDELEKRYVEKYGKCSNRFVKSRVPLRKVVNKRKIPCQMLILQGIFGREPSYFNEN